MPPCLHSLPREVLSKALMLLPSRQSPKSTHVNGAQHGRVSCKVIRDASGPAYRFDLIQQAPHIFAQLVHVGI